MRQLVGVLAAAVFTFACGGNSSPKADGGSGGGGGAVLHALTVAVTGSGVVTSSPAGLNCAAGASQPGTACSASFAQGTSVSLTAAAASGFIFSGWGGACSGQSACTVTLSGDSSVTASFTAVPPQPQQSFTVTVTTNGSGRVTSSPAGLDCGTNCSAKFAAGTHVALTATPANGFSFAGFGGDCSGMTCAVTADANVSAQFTALPPPPPPPNMHNLTVSVNGQGTVVSTPPGISCMASCSATFADGAQVQLAAQPAAGWQLSSFAGACSGQSCTVTMSADQSVTATFTQIPPPPPPADECAGLMPPNPLPAPVDVVMPQGGCIAATSDDGAGTFMLGYWGGRGPNFPEYLFYELQAGQPVRVGDTVMGGDEGSLSVFSQPVGFTTFSVSGMNGGSGLSWYSHDGVRTTGSAVASSAPGDFSHFPSSALGIDPAGGAVAVAHNWDTSTGWSTTFQRFDKNGNLEIGGVTVDSGVDYSVGAVGVALSGHVLVMEAAGSYAWRLRWLDRNGAPLTDWFTISGSIQPEFLVTMPTFQFLMDGSLVQGFRYPSLHWQHRFADGSTTPDVVPAWLAQRPADPFLVVRNGKAYASWGTQGPCGGSNPGLEILAASTGKSCGCVAAPRVESTMSVGRDGSLMLSDSTRGCTWHLYPQLLK